MVPCSLLVRSTLVLLLRIEKLGFVACLSYPSTQDKMNNIEVSVGDGSSARTALVGRAPGHSTFVVAGACLIGALVTALPLSILLVGADAKVAEELAPEYDWSFEGSCADFNATHQSPQGVFDTSAFSFEFFVRPPFTGIAMTNTANPTTPSAKEVHANQFFNHMSTPGMNAILRVHKYGTALAVQLPFTTTAAAGACTKWPPDWQHTMEWSCATIRGDSLLGKEHRLIADIAADDPFHNMTCSLCLLTCTRRGKAHATEVEDRLFR